MLGSSAFGQLDVTGNHSAGIRDISQEKLGSKNGGGISFFRRHNGAGYQHANYCRDCTE